MCGTNWSGLQFVRGLLVVHVTDNLRIKDGDVLPKFLCNLQFFSL